MGPKKKSIFWTRGTDCDVYLKIAYCRDSGIYYDAQNQLWSTPSTAVRPETACETAIYDYT